MTRTFLSISAYKLAVRIGYRWGKDAPDECLFVGRSSLSHVTTAFVSSSRADVVIHLENGETHTFAEPTLDVANATAQIISGYVWNDDTAHECPPIRLSIDAAIEWRHRWENGLLDPLEEAAGFRA